MSSRENILKAIFENKPDPIPIPEISIIQQTNANTLLEQFVNSLRTVGGTAVYIQNIAQLSESISQAVNSGKRVVNMIEDLIGSEMNIQPDSKAAELESLDEVFIGCHLGVAENGAVWIDETRMTNRLLPFICQHLKVLLYADNIVSTMHEAYDDLNITKTGYGVFIAGPSKTADIEQSLVTGAHGARTMEVYLLQSPNG